MNNPLKIAPPPQRRAVSDEAAPAEAVVAPVAAPAPSPSLVRSPRSPSSKFQQIKEDGRVQFNKRLPRRVADGFEMLAIRSRKKVPELLAEALELLESRYGKVG
jgi:hypothetical protein